MPSKVAGIEEDYSDPCHPDTLKRIMANIEYYSAPDTFNREALSAFQSLFQKAEKKCGLVIRSMHNYTHTIQRQQQKPTHIHTLIGFKKVNIYPDGSTCFCQEGKTPEKQPNLSITPDCLIMLENNSKPKNKEEKTK